MNYKIEKGIEMPKTHYGMVKFPFGDMKIGDSFRVGGYTPNLQTRVTSAWGAWKSHNPIAKREDWKCATRKVGNQLRVWRIK